MDLKQAEIKSTSPRLLFYKDKDSSSQEPFILTLGKQLSNRRVLVHLNKEPDFASCLGQTFAKRL